MPEHIPSDEMYNHVDCRYIAVVLTARRARQLMAADPTSALGKPLLRAFDELMDGQLHYEAIDPEEMDTETILQAGVEASSSDFDDVDDFPEADTNETFEDMEEDYDEEYDDEEAEDEEDDVDEDSSSDSGSVEPE